MKNLVILLLYFLIGPLFAESITINWGNADPSTMFDSQGNTLLSGHPTPPGTGSFLIELGTFSGEFTPDPTNYNEWHTYWRTFDRANFNEDTGAFASDVQILEDGSSDSDFRSDADSFFGQDMWIWMYNQKEPEVLVSEWFLGRVNDWVFPDDVFGPCCGDGLPNQISLTSDWADKDPLDVTLVWGAHSSYTYEGGGFRQADGSDFLVQTYTLIPEPGALFLVIIAFGVSIIAYSKKK